MMATESNINTQQDAQSDENFVCLKLEANNTKIIPLVNLLKELKTGFHAFYTHGSYISGIQDPITWSPKTLKRIFEAHSEATETKHNNTVDLSNLFKPKTIVNPIRVLPISHSTSFLEQLSTPDSGVPLVLINGLASATRAETIQTFFQKLREQLSAGLRYEQSVAYSLNQAASWDLFLEREEFSGIIPGAHNYHEYLLWDSAGLDKKPPVTDQEVWYGAGWMSSRHRKHATAPLQADILNSWLEPANNNLTNSLKNLTKYYQSQQRENYNYESYNNFIRTLCEFLPYHKKDPQKDRYIPSNLLGQRGGPMRWKGLLDDALHLRKRHLLMDGWLTLWPFEENGETVLYLQPGSLAMLYWAAQRANMPYTDSPQAFIDNYEWDYDSHWFGGKWKSDKGEEK